MSITRRQFLLGTASGFILPSYFDKVYAYLENHGEPLIEVPKRFDTDLYAVDQDFGFQLNLGDPDEGPPAVTVREFALQHYGSEKAFLAEWGEDCELDFDDLMDPEFVIDGWARTDSPNARAYYYLQRLDLGPDLNRKDAVGEIRFIDGACPGNDYLGAEAIDQVSLSLVQKRLNELNTGVRVLVL